MQIPEQDYYKILVRPVVIITTISENGIPNAAPFSFSSPISFNPPLYGFGCMKTHDTWKNISENGEFVVNIPDEKLGNVMHILEKKYPYEVSELSEAGLSEIHSKKVKPPRISECNGWFECKLDKFIDIGDHVWIVGRILQVEIRDEYFDEVINVDNFKPILHISGEFFCVEPKIKKFRRTKK